MTPAIESWENRGAGMDADLRHAFGYVYFENGSRVGFALRIPGEPDVWEPRTNGGGQYRPVTRAQLKAAARYLREQGLDVRDP